MPRASVLLLSLFVTSAAAPFAADGAPDLGILLLDPAVWKNGALPREWTSVSETREQEERALRDEEATPQVFNVPALKVRAFLEKAALQEVRITYLEIGLIFGTRDAVAALSPQELEAKRNAFRTLYTEEHKELLRVFTGLFGDAHTVRVGRNARVAMNAKEWTCGEVTIRLFEETDRLLYVSLLSAAAVAKPRDTRAELRQAVRENIVRRENGDVVLSNIPVVDQGERGYCLMGALSMVLRYYGNTLDIEQMAAKAKYREGEYTLSAARTLIRNVASECRLECDEARGFSLRKLNRSGRPHDRGPLLLGGARPLPPALRPAVRRRSHTGASPGQAGSRPLAHEIQRRPRLPPHRLQRGAGRGHLLRELGRDCPRAAHARGRGRGHDRSPVDPQTLSAWGNRAGSPIGPCPARPKTYHGSAGHLNRAHARSESMHILPAVDIKGGKAVRLFRGEADRETVYAESPVDAAKQWADQGATWLHVVDLDGAFAESSQNESLIDEIVRSVSVPVEVGGGIRSLDKARRLVDAGAARVIIGTKALESREFLDELLQALPGKINVGVDARDGYVAVKGWTETSTQPAEVFLRSLKGSGAAAIIYTDISRDGALTGPNVEAMFRATRVTDIPIIASGGVSTLADIQALSKLPLFGIITGKALYEGCFTLAEAMAAAG